MSSLEDLTPEVMAEYLEFLLAEPEDRPQPPPQLARIGDYRLEGHGGFASALRERIAEAAVAETRYGTLESAVNRIASRFTPATLARKLLDLAATVRDDQHKPSRAKELAHLARVFALKIESEQERQPVLAEAHLLVGDCLREEADFRAAEKEFRRAALHVRASGDPALLDRLHRAEQRLQEEDQQPGDSA